MGDVKKVFGKVGKGLAGAAEGFLTGGPTGAVIGGLGGLTSGGGGGIFGSPEITPNVVDPTLPGAQQLGAQLTSNAGNLITRGMTDVNSGSDLDAAMRAKVSEILSGKYAGESGDAYKGLLSSLNQVYGAEDQRRAENERQRFIAEGIGAGTARNEAIMRSQEEVDRNRRAQLGDLALRLGQQERDRIERAVELGGQVQAQQQSRGLRAIGAASDIYGGQRGVVSRREYAPSTFEQIAGTAGALGGAGLRLPSQGRKYGVFGPKLRTTPPINPHGTLPYTFSGGGSGPFGMG